MNLKENCLEVGSFLVFLFCLTMISGNAFAEYATACLQVGAPNLSLSSPGNSPYPPIKEICIRRHGLVTLETFGIGHHETQLTVLKPEDFNAIMIASAELTSDLSGTERYYLPLKDQGSIDCTDISKNEKIWAIYGGGGAVIKIKGNLDQGPWGLGCINAAHPSQNASLIIDTLENLKSLTSDAL